MGSSHFVKGSSFIVSPTGEVSPDLMAWRYDDITVRLNANENVYGPSDAAKKAIQKQITSSFRYPFAEVRALKSKIAAKHNVSDTQVTLGGGSTEILNMAGLAYGLQGGAIVSAFPTFETLLRTAKRFDCEWIQVPVDKEYKHNLAAMEAAITPSTRLMYVVNPNNPTGSLLDPKELRAFCKRVSKQVPVFIDEAYTEFLSDPKKHTMEDLVNEGYDVTIAKTFSKVYGMAGLRVGYAIGPKTRIEQLDRYGLSLSMISKPSIAAASACFDDQEFIKFSAAKNAVSKEITYKLLKEAGYSYIPSSTSFIMFPIRTDGSSFLRKMRARGVGVRSWYFNSQHWCRVSLGSPEDMRAFGKALVEIG